MKLDLEDYQTFGIGLGNGIEMFYKKYETG